MDIDRLKTIFGSRTKALEMLYLMHDLKPVVRQGFYDSEIGKIKDFCKTNSLTIELSPYKVVLADKDKRYSNKGFKVRIEDPRKGMYFAYISKDPNKAAMAETYEYKNDHRGLGILLGYPECCVDFFLKNEPKRRHLDNDYITCTLNNSKGSRFKFYTNLSKRHVDLTLLNHFPHSFECEKSIEMARKHLRLITEYDPNLAMTFANQLRCSITIGNKFIEFY